MEKTYMEKTGMKINNYSSSTDIQQVLGAIWPSFLTCSTKLNG